MKVCGIIAEYNPFHNGHLYHIRKSRQLTGADYLIVVLSGSFVQRGAPAFMDKFVRTQMALEAGADLVIELPALFSCASAEDFAGAGISLLDQLGVTDFLSFGAETQNSFFLTEAAHILALEPPPFAAVLCRCLKEGMTFPKARAEALKNCQNSQILSDSWNERTEQELSSPNNILALEYLKALYRRHSAIEPIIIPRTGAGYHSLDIREPFCSASAIRQYLTENPPAPPAVNPGAAFRPASFPDEISGMLPVHAKQLLVQNWHSAGPLVPDDFSSMLSYQILSGRSRGFTHYLDVSEELSRRILSFSKHHYSFTRWMALLKTKQYTHTRIARCLCHILLQIPQETADFCRRNGYMDYARVLGFRKNSTALLSAIKSNSAIPLLTRNADEKRWLTPWGKTVFQTEQFASALYDLALQQKFPLAAQNKSTHTRGIIVI